MLDGLATCARQVTLGLHQQMSGAGLTCKWGACPYPSTNSLEHCILLARAEVNSYTSDHRWYLGMVFCVAVPANHLETPFILLPLGL